MSLAKKAEDVAFDDLVHEIGTETQDSIYTIGGFIPITSLTEQQICETDGSASDDGELKAVKKTVDRTVMVEAPPVSNIRRAMCATEQASFPSGSTELGTQKNPMVVDDSDSNDEHGYEFPVVEDSHPAHKMRCDPVTIRWDSLTPCTTHKVTLPCTDPERPNFEQLLQDCQPATFGRGGVDVMDESYRKAGKLDESAFSTSFNPYALGIIDVAAQALAPNHCRQTNDIHGLRAELYKLNVYAAPSGKFKSHVDTPRSKHQIGSLVVCIPSVHKGGQLVLRHLGRETVFDWSGAKGVNTIQWAAFYSDVEHEVLEVTSGQRITLTYNLYTTCSANTARLDPKAGEVYRSLKVLLEQPAFRKTGAILGYHCAHAYAHTNRDTIPTLPATFKGVDKLVHACFAETGYTVHVRHLFCFHDFGCDVPDIYSYMLANASFYDRHLGKFKDLKAFYRPTEADDEPYWGSWCPKDEDLLPDNVPVSWLADGLVPFTHTQEGLADDPPMKIIEAWTKNYAMKHVKWLNRPGKEELALVHGAYGNQASIDTRYSRLVVTLEVPPFEDQ